MSTEAEGGEQLAPKEIITQETIKDRAMEFFAGADLTRVGETLLGVMMINTSPYGDGELEHRATLNGFEAARYQHVTTEAQLPQLGEGEDRQLATYSLRGSTLNGDVTVRLTEYAKKGPEIRITHPGTAMSPGKSGGPDRFSQDDLQFVAKTVGITGAKPGLPEGMKGPQTSNLLRYSSTKP